MSRVHLDHNATTPLRPEARAELLRATVALAVNHSSVHASGRAARAELDEARARGENIDSHIQAIDNYETHVVPIIADIDAGFGIEMVVVDQGPDAADDWIAEHVRGGDVVVTADIPLAARCMEAGARVLGTTGREFTEDSIGDRLAMRELKADLRGAGVMSGGPPALSEKDRSRFLSKLDELVQKGLREQPPR